MPGKEPLDVLDGLAGELPAGRDEDGRRLGPVLGLAHQVDGHDERVGGLVGDHQDLRRPGEQVDPHLAVQLPLGLGDVGVAGAGPHVHLPHGLGAERAGRNRLDTTQQQDLVGAGEVHRGDRRRRDLPTDGWRAGRHPGDARDLRRHHRHVRRRDQGITAPRHVGTAAATGICR